MNSPSARHRIAMMASLIVALFATSTSVFAQLLNKVKTPGTAFTVARGEGTADDVAGGRRFRGKAFATLKIRGLLRMPSATGKTEKMQRLAIHFRGTDRSPRLLSVSVCNGGSCPIIINTDVAGDFSTRETSDPPHATGTSNANVWTFNSPQPVGPQSSVVLEVQFGGGFDSVVDNGEFVLLSVETGFPINLTSDRTTIGVQGSLGLPHAAASPTSIWPNGKAYLFKGSEYVRYDPKTDKVDPGYPQPIAGNWPGFPPEFAAGVDAEVVWGNGKVYFFKGDQYLRYDIATDKVDPGYPVPIAGQWPGLWESDIDAGVVWPNGKAYFFKGSNYIRYDIKTDRADAGYPQPIKDNWPGFPASFATGIDRAVMWNNGKAYFFKGSEYIRYDIASDKTDEGPVPIAGHWPGLWE